MYKCHLFPGEGSLARMHLEVLQIRNHLIVCSYRWAHTKATNIYPGGWTQESISAWSCHCSQPPTSLPGESLLTHHSPCWKRVISQAMPGTQASRAGPSAGLSQQDNLGLFWRTATLPGSCTMRLPAGAGYIRYLPGMVLIPQQHQCRVQPASAAAHLAALKWCSGRKGF